MWKGHVRTNKGTLTPSHVCTPQRSASKHETPENLIHQVYSLAKQMGFEQTPAVSPETDYKPHPLSSEREKEKAGEGGESFELDEKDCIWIHISIKK